MLGAVGGEVFNAAFWANRLITLAWLPDIERRDGVILVAAASCRIMEKRQDAAATVNRMISKAAYHFGMDGRFFD
jgi:hypothetical protein